MTLSEKLLNLIGMEPVTNRETIMEEIDRLTDEDFVKLIGMCCKLDSHIDEIICRACKSDHEGICLHPESEGTCPCYKPVEWLSKPNTENLNIKEILI